MASGDLPLLHTHTHTHTYTHTDKCNISIIIHLVEPERRSSLMQEIKCRKNLYCTILIKCVKVKMQLKVHVAFNLPATFES